MTNLFTISAELNELLTIAQCFDEETPVGEVNCWLSDFSESKEAEKEKVEAIAIMVMKYGRMKLGTKEEIKRLKKIEAGHERTEERLKNYLKGYMDVIQKKTYDTEKYKIRHKSTPGRLVMTQEAEDVRRLAHGLPEAEEALKVAKGFMSEFNKDLLKKGRNGVDLPDGIKVVREERLYIS